MWFVTWTTGDLNTFASWLSSRGIHQNWRGTKPHWKELNGGITPWEKNSWILSSKEQSEGETCREKLGKQDRAVLVIDWLKLLLKMSRCGCCRWQQNEVVSCGGEASVGFPVGFWPARRLDSCLGSNWGRWPVQEQAALTLANGNEGNICNEAFQLCPWSSYYLLLRVKVMGEGVVDAPLMAILMPEFLAAPAETESLKVSLIPSSVHHFCCRALVFWFVLLLVLLSAAASVSSWIPNRSLVCTHSCL